jgi:hypothetical protein
LIVGVLTANLKVEDEREKIPPRISNFIGATIHYKNPYNSITMHKNHLKLAA